MALAVREPPAFNLRRRPVLSAQEIQEIATDRLRQNEGRNQQYENYMRYYLGPSRAGSSSALPGVKNMDSKGRPLLRDIGSSTMANHRHFTNLIGPVIDDYQAILGRRPRVRVPPADASADASKAAAEKLTHWTESTMDLSRMDFQQAEAGFFLPCLGDAVYLLEVAIGDTPKEGNRVAISAMSPYYCHPSFMRGFRRFELYDLVLAYYADAAQLKRDYGYDPTEDDPENFLMVTYISPWQRTVLVGKETLHSITANDEGAPYDLGFCAAEWVFNKVINTGTDMAFANSEIANALEAQDVHNWARGVAADGLVYATYPIIHLRKILSFQDEQLTVGPGETVYSEDGDIQIAGSAANPKPAMEMADDAKKDVLAGSGTTSVRIEGDQHSSIQTGRSLHAAQGPQATRIDLRQAQLGAALERVFAKAMEMQERGPHLGKPFEINGRADGKTFREDFDPKADIDGYYRVKVTWDGQLGMNQQQKIMTASQAKQFGLIDDLEAMDMMGIEDPLGMRKRIEQYRAWESSTQPQDPAAGGKGGDKGGPPPQGGPGDGPPQRKAMPFRPPQMAGQAPPTGVPQGVNLDAVQHALNAVGGKLKGTVYASGELAQMGQSTKPLLFVSVLADQKWVKQALDPLVPGVKVQYATEEAMPQDKVRVA